MTDLPALYEKLNGLGLLNKTFMQMTHEEITALCQAVMSSPSENVPFDGWKKPYLDATGTLVIPFDAHPEYYHWRKGGKSIMAILDELDAPEKVREAYREKHQGMRIGES